MLATLFASHPPQGLREKFDCVHFEFLLPGEGPVTSHIHMPIPMVCVGVLGGSCFMRTCWGVRGQCPHLWLALPKGGLGD